MKKKIVIRFSILTISIFLLCTCIFTLYYSNPERFKVKDFDKKSGDIKVYDSNKEFEISIEESNPSSIPEDNNSINTESVITYVCPDGYTLNGILCTLTKSANLTCPNNMTAYSYNNLSGCIILSEGSISEDGTCPNGQGLLEEVHLGSPNIMKCFVIYDKVYTCEDGFTLSGSSCIRTVSANKKTP